MAKPTVGQIERQVREHGYSIEVKVDKDGVCVVTLTASPDTSRYGAKRSFAADSLDNGSQRYEGALWLATARMLDYEYRSQDTRPGVGDEMGARV